MSALRLCLECMKHEATRILSSSNGALRLPVCEKCFEKVQARKARKAAASRG